MKLVILSSLLVIGILPVSIQMSDVANHLKTPTNVSFADDSKDEVNFFCEPSQESEKMMAIVFKAQEYCRAELPDFEFDAKFSVIGATVYFSGTNFKGVETGTLTSNSFKPIRSLISRCGPGSIVSFDNVKVVGPDQLVRTIEGRTYLLH